MLSMGKFLVAAFITWCAVGFVIDLLLVNYQPLGRGFFWPIYFGTLGAAVFAARMGRIGLVPVLLLITGAGLWLAVRISFHSPASPDLEAMHRRVVFDAIGILVGTIVGYRLLVDFIRTEGLATLRIQTELALAHDIQATLVPTVSHQVDRFEVYGKSIPSTEMGGDLIDAVERDGTLLANVADRTNAQCTTGTTRVEETLKIFTLLSPPPEAQTVYGPPAGPVNCSPMKTCRQRWSAKQPPGRLFALVVVGRDQIFAIRVRAMPRGFMPI